MPYSAMILEREGQWQSDEHGGELNEHPLDGEYSFYPIVRSWRADYTRAMELGAVGLSPRVGGGDVSSKFR
jgi:hypothetical protein